MAGNADLSNVRSSIDEIIYHAPRRLDDYAVWRIRILDFEQRILHLPYQNAAPGMGIRQKQNRETTPLTCTHLKFQKLQLATIASQVANPLHVLAQWLI